MTSERPQSALNLRLLLTLFGLGFTIVLGIFALNFRNFGLMVFTVILFVVTIVDLVIIIIRRRRRKRREPDVDHSIFE